MIDMKSLQLLFGLITITMSSYAVGYKCNVSDIVHTNSVLLANKESYFIQLKNGDSIRVSQYKDNTGKEKIECMVYKNNRSEEQASSLFETIKCICQSSKDQRL